MLKLGLPKYFWENFRNRANVLWEFQAAVLIERVIEMKIALELVYFRVVLATMKLHLLVCNKGFQKNENWKLYKKIPICYSYLNMIFQVNDLQRWISNFLLLRTVGLWCYLVIGRGGIKNISISKAPKIQLVTWK